jgi:hypothetical protein
MKRILFVFIFFFNAILFAQQTNTISESRVRAFVEQMIKDYEGLLNADLKGGTGYDRREAKLNVQFLLKYIPKDTLKKIMVVGSKYKDRQLELMHLIPQLDLGRLDSIKMDGDMAIARFEKTCYEKPCYIFVLIYSKNARLWVIPDVTEEVVINLNFDPGWYYGTSKKWAW